jgi:hypothetical protein
MLSPFGHLLYFATSQIHTKYLKAAMRRIWLSKLQAVMCEVCALHLEADPFTQTMLRQLQIERSEVAEFEPHWLSEHLFHKWILCDLRKATCWLFSVRWGAELRHSGYSTRRWHTDSGHCARRFLKRSCNLRSLTVTRLWWYTRPPWWNYLW